MPVSIASTCTFGVRMTYRHDIYVDARQVEPVSIVGGRRRHGCDVAEIRYLVEGSQHAEKEICVMYRDGVILTLRPVKDYYYRSGRLRPAYCSHAKRGCVRVVTCPRAVGRRQCRVQEQYPRCNPPSEASRCLGAAANRSYYTHVIG